MKLSSRQRLTRRDLIRTLGCAALALPGLELFERSARAQSSASRSKFIVFCYTNDGVNQGAFWPRGTPDQFTLSPILQPFERFRDKLLVIGPQMNGDTPVRDTGLAYIAATPQHQAPVTLAARMGHDCTGQFCVGTLGLSYLNQQTAVNGIDGPSIDQVIAKAVQGSSIFRSLEFGLHPVGGDTPSDINFLEDGTSLKRLSSSDEAWARMFGSLPSAPASAAASTTSLNKLNAVSNFLHERFSVLRPALSRADQLTLDAHVTSLQSYESRVQRRLTSSAVVAEAACTNPARATVASDADSMRTGADTETLCPFFMDMIATAFQCDLTKVASITFGYPGGGDSGGLRMPWLGFNDPLHFVSHHGGNPEKLDKYQRMSTWITGQIAALMDRLAAIPSATGAGTLLDETTIYLFNRHGDGDTHSNFALPNIILGGSGGYFEMGRWLQLPATNPTKVLISLAHAMGVELASFGEPSLQDNSPLAALTG
jgi:hypothetical protein